MSKTYTRSFAAGELSPHLFGRLDLAKFQTGMAKCLNFMVTPQGPIQNRPGFEFVSACKLASQAVLIPFAFSTEQTFALELGQEYMRFHTQGATLLSAGVPYEIATPYQIADLFDLHYVQSADVLTITHPNYAPRELRRLGATNWALDVINFLPSIATPVAPTVVASGGSGVLVDCTYRVTAIAADTLEQSLPSPTVTVLNNLSTAGAKNTITPAAVATAVRYNIYKLENGLYGLIGQTDGSDFVDDNIGPDVLQSPPLPTNPFAIGSIVSVPVTAGGAGYNSVPKTGGVITAAAITAGGAGYTTPVATVAGATGSGATITVHQTAGVIDLLTITDGGTLYSDATITISDSGGGTGAGATATVTASTIVEHPLTLTLTDPTGSGAEGYAVVVGGAITAVRVVNGGIGYTTPVLTIADGAGGAGAAFGTPVLTGDDVNPQAVSYFEQRRCFAGSTAKPQTAWFTRSGTEKNLSYSIPTQDDDAITARIVAREANQIRHLVPLGDLLALTSGGVWKIASSGSDVLTPATISARQQGSVGASNVQPALASSSVLYAQDRGNHMREVSYLWQTQRYESEDISVLAPHLFDYKTIVQMAYAKAPVQTLWAVRSDGVLLGMTHLPEHEVKAWHQHDTQGTFESVCAVAEGEEDGVYVIVRRRVNGHSVRYVERLHTRRFGAPADAFFVDAGLTYSGAPATTISGLTHLEGSRVTILADGGVSPPQTVVAGAITLDAPASTVQIGLAYTCDMQTMPLSYEAEALGQGSPKNLNQVALRLYRSASIKAGPTFDKLREFAQRTVTVPYGSPPELVTDVVYITLDPKWQENGNLCVRQSDPLPLEILSMSLEFTSGG